MGLKVGIVGLPNVGKSTLFNALTKSRKAQAENYAFCTIDPNIGMVSVPDPRIQEIDDIIQSKKTIPAVVEFVDIAGLVAGAAQGEGLGNKFLSHIREVDAIAHVVRLFSDKDVTHVMDRVEPYSDIDIISTELLLADFSTIESAISRLEKTKNKTKDKDYDKLYSTLMKIRKELDKGVEARLQKLTKEEESIIKPYCLLTAKSTFFIANTDEASSEQLQQDIKQKLPPAIRPVIALCAKMEQEIAELDAEDAKIFLKELGETESGLQKVIRTGYDSLELITFFTAGPKEIHAWTIKKGMTAQQAAGVIHTDFERGFIRAETIGYDDFIKNKGEKGSRDAGKMRLEGKEYIVKDGDIMHFRFNVSR